VSAQPAPHRHAVPVNAEFLLFDCAFALLDALLQFGQEDLVNHRRPSGSPPHHGRPMRVVPSKKVSGAGLAEAVSRIFFQSSEHSRDRATVRFRSSSWNFLPAIFSKGGTKASSCLAIE